MAFTAEWTVPGDPVCCCPPVDCCPYFMDYVTAGIIIDSDMPDSVIVDDDGDIITLTKDGSFHWEGTSGGGIVYEWYFDFIDVLAWQMRIDGASFSGGWPCFFQDLNDTISVDDEWNDTYTVHVTSGWGSDFDISRISRCEWYGENTYVNEFGELVTYGVRVVIGPLGDPFDPSGYYGFYHTIENPSSPSPIEGSYVKQAPQTSPVGQYSSESWESGGPPVFDGFSIS